MNLQSFKGTPDSLKLRAKGFERKLSLGAPEQGLHYKLSHSRLSLVATCLEQKLTAR